MTPSYLICLLLQFNWPVMATTRSLWLGLNLVANWLCYCNCHNWGASNSDWPVSKWGIVLTKLYRTDGVACITSIDYISASTLYSEVVTKEIRLFCLCNQLNQSNCVGLQVASNKAGLCSCSCKVVNDFLCSLYTVSIKFSNYCLVIAFTLVAVYFAPVANDCTIGHYCALCLAVE